LEFEPGIIYDVSRKSLEASIFEGLVNAEKIRRSEELEKYSDLASFEKEYFGIEVGHIRKAFDDFMISKMAKGGYLLDYGCGKSWYKERYWPFYDKVYALEIYESALLDIREKFKDVILLYSKNGLADLEQKFDVVLSSSVVGFILPIQARYHIKACYELLKPGGQFVLTRVAAFNLRNFIKFEKLVTAHFGTSFGYYYTKQELYRELLRCNFKNIKYYGLGVVLPKIDMRSVQRYYQKHARFMCEVLPQILPFLKCHHMFTATK